MTRPLSIDPIPASPPVGPQPILPWPHRHTGTAF
jgi:hypothetical protein